MAKDSKVFAKHDVVNWFNPDKGREGTYDVASVNKTKKTANLKVHKSFKAKVPFKAIPWSELTHREERGQMSYERYRSMEDGGKVDRIYEMVANSIFIFNSKGDKVNTEFGSKTRIGLANMIANDNYSSNEVANAIFDSNEKNGKIKTSLGDKTLKGLVEVIDRVRSEKMASGGLVFIDTEYDLESAEKRVEKLKKSGKYRRVQKRKNVYPTHTPTGKRSKRGSAGTFYRIFAQPIDMAKKKERIRKIDEEIMKKYKLEDGGSVSTDSADQYAKGGKLPSLSDSQLRDLRDKNESEEHHLLEAIDNEDDRKTKDHYQRQHNENKILYYQLVREFKRRGLSIYAEGGSMASGGEIKDALYGVINSMTLEQMKPHAVNIINYSEDNNLNRAANEVAYGSASESDMIALKRAANEYMGKNNSYAKGGSMASGGDISDLEKDLNEHKDVNVIFKLIPNDGSEEDGDENDLNIIYLGETYTGGLDSDEPFVELGFQVSKSYASGGLFDSEGRKYNKKKGAFLSSEWFSGDLDFLNY